MPSSNGAADKPRLTDDQKKQNHIESEKKRREAIRRGFDSLANIVPGMANSSRSEAVMLTATVDYLRTLVSRKEELREQARKKGMSSAEFERAYSGAREAVVEAESEDDEEGSGSGSGSSSSSGKKVKKEAK